MSDNQQPVELDFSRIDVLNLRPGDIVAIRCHRRITKEMAEEITDQVQGIIGDTYPVMVFPPDLELMVVRYPLDEDT